MASTLVPIFICVILPVAIVLIVFLASMNSDNKRAQVLIKAIEANCNIDADKLAEALRKPRKSEREIVNGRLLYGSIFSLLGLFLTLVGVFNLGIGESGDPVTVPIFFGGASLAIGISFLIVYFVTRRQIDNQEKK